jgi:hypothetical protein
MRERITPIAARREQGVWVNASDERATIIVNPDGTPVSAGGGGGVSIVDDSAFTVGVSSLTVTGGIVTADSVDSGDAGAFKMLANRQQVVSIATSAGVAIDSFGGGTEYTVNAAAPADPVGATFVMERDDALSALTEVEGDWTQPRSNANGALWVATDGAVAVTNAGLTALAGAIGGNEVQVDVLTMPTVTINSPAVTNAGTFAVQVDGAALTSLQLIDDVVYTDDTSTHATGTSKGALFMAAATPTDSAVNANDIGALAMTTDRKLHVSVQDAIPAGNNNIGDVDIASIAAGNNNIGDVDVASIVPGVGATNLGKAEDAAHTSGDVGVMMLAVRQDSQTGLAADGDYLPPTIDSSGGMRVSIVAGAGSGGTAAADDADFTAGTTQGTPGMGVYESTPTSVTDGDLGTFGITPKRSLKVTLYDATGAEVSVGGGTQYDEDTASADAQKLTMAGVTRADTAATQVNTDGDRSTLIVDASGRLHVNVGNSVTVATHAVTNAAGAFVVQENGAALTALQLIDDIVYTDDTSTHATGTSKGALFMAAAVPTDTAVSANDIGAVAMTTDRKLHVAVMDALPAGSAAIGKLAANAGVTIGAVEIAAAQTLATVTTVSTVTAVTTLTGSGIAHDGADSGNPHKVGGRARSSEIAAVANNDRSDLVTDLVGKLIVLPYANPENFVSGAITSAMTGTTSTSLVAAPASGLRNYITQITVSNAHATVGTDVVIQDGSGGTTLYTIPAAAVYGGATLNFPVPLRQPTTATAIFCANVTTGASTKVSASGYIGA